MTDGKKARRAKRQKRLRELAADMMRDRNKKYSPRKARFFARVVYDREVAARKTA